MSFDLNPRQKVHWRTAVQNKLLEMGAAAECQITEGTAAFLERDVELAARVLARQKEVDIEAFLFQFSLSEEHSPEDVRFFATAVRIGRKLERIEKAGADIARIALTPQAQPYLKPLSDLSLMSGWIQTNLRLSLRSFAEHDWDLAGRVVRDSSFLDDVYDQILRRMFTYIAPDPQSIRLAPKPMFVARCLQHAGDHVVDVAEMIVLLLQSQPVWDATA